MAVRVSKLSVSFPPKLARAVKRAAARSNGGNVSAWLAEAAEAALLHHEAAESVAEWEAEHGKITEAEIAEARRKWLS